MIVAGLGCRRGCPAQDIRAALAVAGPVDLVAIPAFKAGEPGLLAVVPDALVLSDEQLAGVQEDCLTRSAVARRATGFASIAEACALAAAGPGGRLLGPRMAVGGATCAVAVSA